jgi:hypothetical protein
MTYQNDPNRDFNRPLDPDPADRRFAAHERWGTGSVIIASLAAIAVVFGLFYAMSNRSDTSLANRNDNRPAVTTNSNVPPAATTGSGAANRMPDATGKPVEPAQVPASPPSNNR